MEIYQKATLLSAKSKNLQSHTICTRPYLISTTELNDIQIVETMSGCHRYRKR